MENKFKIYWTKISEQLKKFFSHVFWVVLVLAGIGIGFGVGFYYKQIKTVEMPSKMVVVEKQNIIFSREGVEIWLFVILVTKVV